MISLLFFASIPMFKSKYRNKKTIIDGICFDSKKEASRYTDLRLLERAGEIVSLECQPRYKILDGFRYAGKTYRASYYIADFRWPLRAGRHSMPAAKNRDNNRNKFS